MSDPSTSVSVTSVLTVPGDHALVATSQNGDFFCRVDEAVEIAYMVNLIEGLTNDKWDLDRALDIFEGYVRGNVTLPNAIAELIEIDKEGEPDEATEGVA